MDLYGKRPVYPETNYDRTYHSDPPTAQQYTRRGISRQRAQGDVVAWDTSTKAVVDIHGDESPPLPKSKNGKRGGKVKPGTQIMFDEYDLGTPTFFTVKDTVTKKPAYNRNGSPLLGDNGKQAMVSVKVMDSVRAKFLNGPIYPHDPLDGFTVAASLLFDSPDLAVTNIQAEQVDTAERLNLPGLVPVKFHPKAEEAESQGMKLLAGMSQGGA